MDAESRTLAAAITELLGDRRLACAESMTAGRLATTFAAVDDAVSFFRGGLVAYQSEIKTVLLGVTAASVLTLEAAEQMAHGVARLLAAEVAVSTTGLAGGAPVDDVEVGTVFIGTSVDGAVRSTRHHFRGSPEQVCDAATRRALTELLDAIQR
jgi:nicotinamide-nucleotide amidase